MGKIGVPDAILLKPGALTDAEMDRVRGHSKMSLSVGVEELGLVTWWAWQDRVVARGQVRLQNLEPDPPQ